MQKEKPNTYPTISYLFPINARKDDNCMRYDYSRLLLNNNTIGCIGNGQRLYIHFDTIYKDKKIAELYHVIGKSRVKDKRMLLYG